MLSKNPLTRAIQLFAARIFALFTSDDVLLPDEINAIDPEFAARADKKMLEAKAQQTKGTTLVQRGQSLITTGLGLQSEATRKENAVNKFRSIGRR